MCIYNYKCMYTITRTLSRHTKTCTYITKTRTHYNHAHKTVLQYVYTLIRKQTHGQTQGAHKHTDQTAQAYTHVPQALPRPKQALALQRGRSLGASIPSVAVAAAAAASGQNKRLAYPITSTWKSCGPTEVTLEDHGSRTHLRRKEGVCG